MIGLTSSKQQGFDIRIVSQWGGKSQWTNSELNDTAIKAIHQTRIALGNIGFDHSHYLNVLVEKHIGAIHSPIYGAGTCLAVGAFGMIETPNIFGGRSLFFGDMKSDQTLSQMPRILVLKAYTPQLHSLFNPFTIAHELAHDSEIPGSPRALLWIEARSDFLAFAVTGKNENIWPSGFSKVIYDINGNENITSAETKRSLINPDVEYFNDLIANRHAYHENSLIISSFLFRLSNKFNLETVLSFVRWMDEQESTLISDFSPTQDSNGEEIKKGLLVKKEWQRVAEGVFNAITNWSATQDEDIRNWIEIEIQRISK